MLRYRCLKCGKSRLLVSDITTQCDACNGVLWLEKNWMRMKGIAQVWKEEHVLRGTKSTEG